MGAQQGRGPITVGAKRFGNAMADAAIRVIESSNQLPHCGDARPRAAQ